MKATFLDCATFWIWIDGLKVRSLVLPKDFWGWPCKGRLSGPELWFQALDCFEVGFGILGFFFCPEIVFFGGWTGKDLLKGPPFCFRFMTFGLEIGFVVLFFWLETFFPGTGKGRSRSSFWTKSYKDFVMLFINDKLGRLHSVFFLL